MPSWLALAFYLSWRHPSGHIFPLTTPSLFRFVHHRATINMATQPKSALPSFYGERRPDGSIIERTPEGLSNPAAATQQSPSHSQRSITISSAQQRGHDELASVRTKDHSTSDDPAHGEGVRYRHWAPHKPAILSSTVRAGEHLCL